MSKKKTTYICSNCGSVFSKWAGCCSFCGEWNSLNQEDIVLNEFSHAPFDSVFATSLKDVDVLDEQRYLTGIEELDYLFGGGIVKGSISLIGGEPGIGKSTLLLQICYNLAKSLKILYISGEESSSQIKLRANRLGIESENIFIFSNTNMEEVCGVILKERPKLAVIDSIQTISLKSISSSSGSATQIRQCTYILQRIAKKEDISIILVGHVNKEGLIAGPKILEHIVDTVLYFEGDSKNSFRMVRVFKNRFGSVNEVAVFDMKKKGLIPVKNPSAIFLDERPRRLFGSCVCAVMNGNRPIFAEVQALVSRSNFGLPRRMCKGLDYNKLILILAVLEKRVGFFFQNSDCYVNVVGGIKLEGPAADLAIAISLIAGLKGVNIKEDLLLLGEIGLKGELRAVSGVEKTVVEAEKLGFKEIVLPAGCLKSLKDKKHNIKLSYADSLKDAVSFAIKNN